MYLYFINDSKQKKELIETNYVEDIYDTLDAFFEEHQFRPHFLQTSFENGWNISFGSHTERFIVEEYTDADVEDARKFLQEMMEE